MARVCARARTCYFSQSRAVRRLGQVVTSTLTCCDPVDL